MDQRTSIMISAILFAAVVAGSISYLIYTRPADDVALAPTSTPTEATPTPVREATIEPSPAELPIASLETTPALEPLVAAAVNPSAPTGPMEMTALATGVMALAGIVGLRRFLA